MAFDPEPYLTSAPLKTPYLTYLAISSVPRYMITSLDRTHAGFYRCIVRNRMGALLQRQTEVQVACEYSGDWGNNGSVLVPFTPVTGQWSPSFLVSSAFSFHT